MREDLDILCNSLNAAASLIAPTNIKIAELLLRAQAVISEAKKTEQKEGEWIHDIHYGLKLPEHRCSICGEWEYSDTESKFCPNCGAKMERSE